MTTATAHRPSLTASRGPYARPPHCDEHGDYHAGCPKCRRYQAWTARRHRLAVELGQPLSYDIDEVRDHIRALQRAGMRLDDIATAADVNRSTVSGIRYQANRRFVCRDNALRILAVPVPTPTPGPRTANLVPVLGTLRRMRALARIGWTFTDIIAASGTDLHRLDQVKDQEWVTVRFAAAIQTAYEALSMQRGPSVQTAARAAKKGWPPPLAWNDDEIDNPAATPAVDVDDAAEPQGYDPVIVGFAVDGRLTYDQIAGHRPDLIETVRRLARSMDDLKIALHLRWPGAEEGPNGKTKGQSAVCQLRKRNGIPACSTREAIAPTRTRDRVRAERRRTAELAA